MLFEDHLSFQWCCMRPPILFCVLLLLFFYGFVQLIQMFFNVRISCALELLSDDMFFFNGGADVSDVVWFDIH